MSVDFMSADKLKSSLVSKGVPFDEKGFPLFEKSMYQTLTPTYIAP